MSTQLLCRHCGSRISAGLRYCPECGTAIDDAAAAAPVPAGRPSGAAIPTFSPQPSEPPRTAGIPSRAVLIAISAVALLGAVAALGWLLLQMLQPGGLAGNADDERPLVTIVQAQTRTPAVQPSTPITPTAAVQPTAAALPTATAALPSQLTALPLPTLALAVSSPTALPQVFSVLPAAAITVRADQTAPDGVDACGNRVSYPAENLIDGNPETAWRVVGDGIGSSIELQLERPYLINELQLIVGYAKYDRCDRGVDRWPQGYRAAELRLDFSDGSSQAVTLQDVRELQSVRLAQPVRTELIRVTVLRSNRPLVDFPNRYAAISEISLVGAP
jgi:hypothetical protein